MQLLVKAQNYFKNYKNVFVIYSMGKVGSTSVYLSLQNSLWRHMVYHTHYLFNDNLNRFKDTPFEWNIENAEQIINILKTKRIKNIKIITLVRDPIAREISNIFQNPFIINDIVTELTPLKISNFIESRSEYIDSTLNWFDDEFNRFLDINIYHKIRDFRYGYLIQNTNNYSILILKLENLTGTYRRAISEFSRIDSILHSENMSSSKIKAINYQELFKDCKFSKSFIDEVYDSKYMKAFYSELEIQDLKQRWIRH